MFSEVQKQEKYQFNFQKNFSGIENNLITFPLNLETIDNFIIVTSRVAPIHSLRKNLLSFSIN